MYPRRAKLFEDFVEIIFCEIGDFMTAANGERYDIRGRTKGPNGHMIESCKKSNSTPYSFKDADGFSVCMAAMEGLTCAYQADAGERFPLCMKQYVWVAEKAKRRLETREQAAISQIPTKGYQIVGVQQEEAIPLVSLQEGQEQPKIVINIDDYRPDA